MDTVRLERADNFRSISQHGEIEYAGLGFDVVDKDSVTTLSE